MMKRLLAIMGPTAVGKTAMAIKMAQWLGTEIVSFDSRQFYEELNIGVARPTEEELSAARHHFIACRSVRNPYNVSQYEDEALVEVRQLFESHDVVVAVGGSGLYLDALTDGMARMPDPSPELRASLKEEISKGGLEDMKKRLRDLDPEYYERVDLCNPIRVQRALEVIITTGRKYSEVVSQSVEPREFEVSRVALVAEREELRERIDRRVDIMMDEGLEEEVISLKESRELTPLNTVGYKELFSYMDGGCSREEAVKRVKFHTWQYAKKQQTWLNRYEGLTIVARDDEEGLKRVLAER